MHTVPDPINPSVQPVISSEFSLYILLGSLEFVRIFKALKTKATMIHRLQCCPTLLFYILVNNNTYATILNQMRTLRQEVLKPLCVLLG